MTLEDAPADPAAPTRRSLRTGANPAADAAHAGIAQSTPDEDAIVIPPKPPAPPSAPDSVPPAAASGDAAGDPTEAEPAPTEPETTLAEPALAEPESALAVPETPEAPVEPAPAPVALAWVDVVALERRAAASASPDAAPEAASADPDLLAKRPHRSPWRPGVIVPIVFALLVAAAYSTLILMWPLHAIPPEVTAVEVQPVAAPAAAPVFPDRGSAAVRVEGIAGDVASADKAVPMASITKVVTALLVLDEMPLEPGEDGPRFFFTQSDSLAYWGYLAQGESALDVPVGGSLTQYQMLEGMLIGSANNYADRLAGNLWPTDQVYAAAANRWLEEHGLSGIRVVEPTGIDPANRARPAALLALAKRALADPVIAEIVAKKSVRLPGAGVVKNTNRLLVDEGVIGVKTGSLDTYSLLSAKEVPIGDTTVRMYASVLSQPSDKARIVASRDLYDSVVAELQPVPSVPRGTVVGEVTTVWGDEVDVVTERDASVILWNGGVADLSTTFALGDQRDERSTVGSLTATGPLDAASVDLVLADDVDPPSPWWLLTHPLQVLGLSDLIEPAE